MIAPSAASLLAAGTPDRAKGGKLVLVSGAKWATWRRYDSGVPDLQDLGRTAMIIDRYPPRRLFRLVPDLPQTFEPELAQLDQLLEDDAIFGRVKADMARRRPHSLTLGRPGTPVERPWGGPAPRSRSCCA